MATIDETEEEDFWSLKFDIYVKDTLKFFEIFILTLVLSQMMLCVSLMKDEVIKQKNDEGKQPMVYAQQIIWIACMVGFFFGSYPSNKAYL